MRISDWSSDVCSSDLLDVGNAAPIAQIVLMKGETVLARGVGQRRGSRRHAPAEAGAGGALLVEMRPYPGAPVAEPPRAVRNGDFAQLLPFELRQFQVLEHDVDEFFDGDVGLVIIDSRRSEEHTSELQSLMRISYAVFC